MQIAKLYDEIAGCHGKRKLPSILPLSVPIISPVVDPATIGLIIEGASFLLNLFGSKDGSDVGEWLKQINDQLSKIAQLLGDILKLLQDLKVYLDEKFRQDAEADVISLCRTYITLAPQFSAKADSPEYQGALLGLLIDINKASNKLMGYGYINAYSVCFALRIQLDLMTLLKSPKAAKQNVFKNCADYFESASNPSIPTSIASRIPIIEGEIELLVEQYPPQKDSDRLWDPPLYWWESEVHHQGCGDSEIITRQKREHIHLILNGSLDTTFTGSLIGGDVYFGNIEGVTVYNNRDAALSSAMSALNNTFLPTWNTAAFKYKMLRAEQDALKKALDACAQFKALCIELENAATES